RDELDAPAPARLLEPRRHVPRREAKGRVLRPRPRVVAEVNTAEQGQVAQPRRLATDLGDEPGRLSTRRRQEHLHRRPEPGALVTGAGRGIGREIALALAREGCHVAVVARSSDQVAATAAAVAGLGVRAMPLVLDVTDESAVTRGVASIAASLGPVDVLVNNAGIAESAPFVKTDTTLWERHLRVNATAPYLLARAVLP